MWSKDKNLISKIKFKNKITANNSKIKKKKEDLLSMRMITRLVKKNSSRLSKKDRKNRRKNRIKNNKNNSKKNRGNKNY